MTRIYLDSVCRGGPPDWEPATLDDGYLLTAFDIASPLQFGDGSARQVQQAFKICLQVRFGGDLEALVR